MANTRVHQLAKDLGLDSKAVIDEAEKHGIKVRNHMSSLDPSEEMVLRAFLEPQRPAPAPVAPTPPPPPMAPRPTAPAASDGPREIVIPRPGGLSGPPAPREVSVQRPGSPQVAARHVDAGPQRPPPPRSVVAGRPGGPSGDSPPRPTSAEPDRSRLAARPMEPRTVNAAPRTQAEPTRPPEIAARPPGLEVRATRPGEVTTVSRRPAAETEGPPPEVRSIQGATATPPGAADAAVVRREPSHQRRPAQILGRKELPPRPTRPMGPPPPGGPRRGPSQGPATGGAGTGGSGLIVTRQEDGKRTFTMTGRGRPSGPPNRSFGPPTTAGGRGRPRGRDTGERQLRGPRRNESQFSVPENLTIEMPITVKGLSEKLGIKANVLIQTLFLNHKKALKINDIVDSETVELLGIEFNCEITTVEKVDIETKVLEQLGAGWESQGENLLPRAPIVTFLGHVDHGKTSLLDALRSTNVAAKEHGGITQHIGASRVELPDGRAVVFLDTPGHRAFTEMRARGAQVTDIVVLVVAADDGVMPQTKEAISHAKAAKVPVIVAMNKIDKPDANPTRVRQELASEGLQDENWGGDTMIVETSATTGKGLEALMEAILLNAEMLDLRADATRPALGTVIEAEQSRGEGNLARVLVRDGTLRKGDFFVCGSAHGRVRAIRGPSGGFIDEAPPSTPVVITGLQELPSAGDKFYVLEDLNQAKEIATKRIQLAREREIAKATNVSLDNLFDRLKGAVLKIIVKVDVTGSKEVLQREIMGLVHPEVRPEIIHCAVGGITETDVALADASRAIICGFHVTADMGARKLADEKKVDIRTYQVIYQLIDDLRDALEGKLEPDRTEVILGEAEVRQTWKVSRLGTIAGCFVRTGLLKRSLKVRVSRDGVVVHDNGTFTSLKRFKDDVREVKEGFECGILVQGFEGIREGDIVLCYEIRETKRTLTSPPRVSP